MNELGSYTLVGPKAIPSASSVPGNNTPVTSGNVLPAVGYLSQTSELNQAIEFMNDYVQSIQRDLQFTVDEDLNRTVIKVTDRRSGELIRQIPDEIFLELARKLIDDGELHLIRAFG